MEALVASMAVQAANKAGSEGTLPGLVQHRVKLFEELRHGSSLVDTPPVKEVRPGSSLKQATLQREVERVAGEVRRRAQCWEQRNHRANKRAEPSSGGASRSSPLKREDEEDLLSAMDDLLRAAHELELEYDRSFDTSFGHHEHSAEELKHHCSECSHNDLTIPEEEEGEEPAEGQHGRKPVCFSDDSAAAFDDGDQGAEATEPELDDETFWSSRHGQAELMWADATRSAAASLQKQAEALLSLRFPDGDAARWHHQDDDGTTDPSPAAAEQPALMGDDVQGLVSASIDLVDLAGSVLSQMQDANQWARELSSHGSREATAAVC